MQEASDKGTYLPYWENITKLVATVSESQDENEIVNLEVYKLAMNAVETYARKFKADDVAQEDMKALLEQVKAGTEQVDTTTDKTEEMKCERKITDRKIHCLKEVPNHLKQGKAV